MTPNEVITEVRRLIQDTRVGAYRYSDASLLGYVNQTLKRMVVLRPDLFMTVGELTTTPNTVVQSLPSGAYRLSEIFSVKDGNAVIEVNRDMLDQSAPGWVSEAAGTPVNFARHVRNPTKYFLYPRPTTGIVLIGEYVATPPNYTADQTIAVLPDTYFPTLVDGTIFLAESEDNEHVNSGRAKLFQDSFTQSLGVGLQTRAVTDTEEGGQDPAQVI